MLEDLSPGRTTCVTGRYATPFQPGRKRRVAVGHRLNTELVLGQAAESDRFRFKLKWYHDRHKFPPNYAASLAERRISLVECLSLRDWDARQAQRRAAAADTSSVRSQGEDERQPILRYAEGPCLGSGSYGTVYKAVNVDTGRIIAVKVIEMARHEHSGQWRQKAKREVDIIAGLRHPCILGHFASQGWEGRCLELFMDLKEGSLADLIDRGQTDDEREWVDKLLRVSLCDLVDNLDGDDMTPRERFGWLDELFIAYK
ncbi:MAG: hypothetical protein M1817_003040 [Caeruleum heppii]|nr:MAG: hypothetical protein M1817_003040 [Caeruleum heppii]